MPAKSESRDDVVAWMDSLDAVVRSRRRIERSLVELDRQLLAARAVGATWDELAFATGQTRTTVRRWAADAAAPKPRRLAVLRATLAPELTIPEPRRAS